MRARRLQSSLLMLAFASVLLMALAPVVSRVLQSRDGQQLLMATHTGHAMHEGMPADGGAGAMHHPGMNPHAAPHDGMGPTPMDHALMDHASVDQAAMNHSGMNHSAMDHSGMGHSGMDHHSMSGGQHALPPASASTDNRPPPTPPADPHAGHGEACEYCTMASRLLPWLAVMLVLAPLLYRLVPLSPRVITLPASLRWPAHPVRGPPLFS